MEEENQNQTIQEQAQSFQNKRSFLRLKKIILSIIVLISILIFIPIPYYQDSVVLCKMGVSCPGIGWYPGPSLFQNLKSRLLFPASQKGETVDLSKYKKCPDGVTLVGRPCPNCEFSPCLTTPTPTNQTSNWETYEDKTLGIFFKYPESNQIQIDTESKYAKRSNLELPRDFIKLKSYNPPKVISAIHIVNIPSKDVVSANDLIFDVWIFSNPNNLSIDEWYQKYWYYPFSWGEAIRSEIEKNKPDKDTFVDNIPTKYAIFNEKGEIKYLYVRFNQRIYLFNIMNNSLGNQILSTFKFTENNVESSGQQGGKAKVISYQLPSGWQTAGNTSGGFEVGYDPTRYNPNPSNIGIDLNSKACCSSIFFRLLPYDGGSRHTFIKNQGALKLPNTIEKEYLISGKSSLFQYGVDFSGSNTAGVVIINNSQALFISSQS